MIESHDGGVMTSGAEDIERVRWLRVRSALKLEILTGMKRSNRGRSTLVLANEITGTDHKTKRAAYGALNAHIVSALGASFDRPLQ
jgi:hypothetical protein